MLLPKCIFILIVVLVISTSISISPTLSLTATSQKIRDKTEDELCSRIRTLAKEAGHPYPNSVCRHEDDSEVCYTKQCLLFSIKILETMDFKADPCNKSGFGKYACQRRIHPDPGDKYLKYITYNDMDSRQLDWNLKDNMKHVLEILNDPISPDYWITNRPIETGRIYYSQCMEFAKNKEQGSLQFLELSKRFGGWALLTQQEPVGFQWESLAAFNLRFTDKSLLFDVSPVYMENGLELSLGKGVVASKYFNDEDLILKITSLLQLIRENWKNINATFNLPESFENGIKATVDVAVRLRAVTAYSNTNIQRMTISQLNEFTQHRISWLKFFRTVYMSTDVDIDKDTMVHVDKSYVDTMTKMWDSAAMFESSLLQYELFNSGLHYTSFRNKTMEVSKDISKMQSIYNKTLDELHCIRTAEYFFRAAIRSEILQKYFKKPDFPVVKNHVNDILNKILEGFKEYVDSFHLLNSSSKSKLKNKISKMKRIFDYPGWKENDEIFTRFYLKLEPFDRNQRDFLKNMINMNAWWFGSTREQLENVNFPNAIRGDIAYDPLFNEITIPPLRCLTPLYNYDGPGFINYGGLGARIAKQLGQTMDTNGMLYDAHGNYKKEGILDLASKQKYNKWVEELRLEYNRSVNLNDSKQGDEPFVERLFNTTINNEIANIIGLQAAFNGYKKYLQSLPDEEDVKLPGLDHITDEEMFFIYFANMHCQEPVDPDPKSTSNRIMLLSTYSKQFLETFECRNEENRNYEQSLKSNERYF